MSAPTPDLALFQVMHFCLGLNADGQPTQSREVIGRHRHVETAFVTAQLAAVQCCRRLRQSAPAATHSDNDNEPDREARSAAERIQLCDTEWGYDVRREGLVVERFWVHDRSPADLNF